MAKKKKTTKKTKLDKEELQKEAIDAGVKNVDKKSQSELIQELEGDSEPKLEPIDPLKPENEERKKGHLTLTQGRIKVDGRTYTKQYLEVNQRTAKILYDRGLDAFFKVH